MMPPYGSVDHSPDPPLQLCAPVRRGTFPKCLLPPPHSRQRPGIGHFCCCSEAIAPPPSCFSELALLFPIVDHRLKGAHFAPRDWQESPPICVFKIVSTSSRVNHPLGLPTRRLVSYCSLQPVSQISCRSVTRCVPQNTQANLRVAIRRILTPSYSLPLVPSASVGNYGAVRGVVGRRGAFEDQMFDRKGATWNPKSSTGMPAVVELGGPWGLVVGDVCVSGISDKSTRKTALKRAFSARNASSLSQFVKIGMRSTTFQRHFFASWPADLKPGAQMGALDVSVGEFHRSNLA